MKSQRGVEVERQARASALRDRERARLMYEARKKAWKKARAAIRKATA